MFTVHLPGKISSDAVVVAPAQCSKTLEMSFLYLAAPISMKGTEIQKMLFINVLLLVNKSCLVAWQNFCADLGLRSTSVHCVHFRSHSNCPSDDWLALMLMWRTYLMQVVMLNLYTLRTCNQFVCLARHTHYIQFCLPPARSLAPTSQKGILISRFKLTLQSEQRLTMAPGNHLPHQNIRIQLQKCISKDFSVLQISKTHFGKSYCQKAIDTLLAQLTLNGREQRPLTDSE